MNGLNPNNRQRDFIPEHFPLMYEFNGWEQLKMEKFKSIDLCLSYVDDYEIDEVHTLESFLDAMLTEAFNFLKGLYHFKDIQLVKCKGALRQGEVNRGGHQYFDKPERMPES